MRLSKHENHFFRSLLGLAHILRWVVFVAILGLPEKGVQPWKTRGTSIMWKAQPRR
jgi:hypothetical protein